MQRRKISAHEKRMVAAGQQWRCKSCDALLDATFHIDHAIPLWNGGDDEQHNFQALCVSGHAHKTQAEEVDRLRAREERRRSKALFCFRCEQTVSPYFIHRCR